MTSREDRLAAFTAEIQKSAGKEHFQMSSDMPKMPPMIPTGCLELDSMLGGGFAAGAVHMLWGEEAGGKTTTALHAVANLHKKCASCYTFIKPRPALVPEDNKAGRLTRWMGKRLRCRYCAEPYHVSERPPVTAEEVGEKDVPPKAQICEGCGVIEEDLMIEVGADEDWLMPFGKSACECGKNEPTMVLFMDFENRLDKVWAATIGCDLTRMIHEVPAYGEQGLDIIRRAIVDGLVDGIVIDSIANISSSEEMLKTSGDKSVATTARMVNRFLRSLPGWQVTSRDKWSSRVTIWAINQIRTNLSGNAFTNNDTAFGGMGQKYAATTITKYVYSKAEKDEVVVGNEKKHEKMGLSNMTTITVRCEKSSRSSSRGLTRQLRLVTADDGLLRKGEWDDYAQTWKQGRATGVIAKDGDEWKAEGWPVSFARKEDMEAEFHSNLFFKLHTHAEIIRRIHEGDWTSVREHLSKGKS